MEAIPDREPWRRGRTAIVVISIVLLAGQALGLAAAALAGNVTGMFEWAIGGTIACLLIYLIWIGQNWARWITAPLFGVSGFVALVQALIHSSEGTLYAGELFVAGVAALTMFSYLALSPAVYAFARRQRENASWLEIIGVAAGFILVLGSIGSALLAFEIYERGLEQEATEFAELSFKRVFLNHDAAFLGAHSSGSRKASGPGAFVYRAENELGKLQEVGPFNGKFAASIDGRRIKLHGTVRTRALFEDGGRWVNVTVSGREGEWWVDHIQWTY